MEEWCVSFSASCFLVCLSPCLIKGLIMIDSFIFYLLEHWCNLLHQTIWVFPSGVLNPYFQRASSATDEWWKSQVTLHPPRYCSCPEPTSRCAKTGRDGTFIIKGLHLRQRWVQVCGKFQSFIWANFLPHSVVFSRLCCLWWTISDVLIVAVGTNYCMQIWARCHFWAASLCHCCQLVVSLLKRHFTVSESAGDENPWLELRSCFHGLMFLSKMWALMRTLFLGFRRNTFKWVMYSKGYGFQVFHRHSLNLTKALQQKKLEKCGKKSVNILVLTSDSKN